MSTTARRLLVADIGGTNVRFGWAQAPTTTIRDIHQFPCRNFSDLGTAIAHYTVCCGVEHFNAAALGVATAITGDRVEMTNHHWTFSQAQIREQFAFDRLLVMNDFTALALSLPTLQNEDFVNLGEGRIAITNEPIALLGAGTGLGMSGLLPCGEGRWLPIAGEGGHATLAPNSALEFDVVQFLRGEFGHVSAERVLSGPGLVNLYRAVCFLLSNPVLNLTPAEVISKAKNAQDIACVTAIELFCSFLGGTAGNLALSLGSRGGVYIGGGIAPRLLRQLQKPSFRESFENKGRFGDYLRDIPIRLITAQQSPALRGAAQALLASQS